MLLDISASWRLSYRPLSVSFLAALSFISMNLVLLHLSLCAAGVPRRIRTASIALGVRWSVLLAYQNSTKGFRIQYGRWIHLEKPISRTERFEPLPQAFPKGNPTAAKQRKVPRTGECSRSTVFRFCGRLRFFYSGIIENPKARHTAQGRYIGFEPMSSQFCDALTN